MALGEIDHAVVQLRECWRRSSLPQPVASEESGGEGLEVREGREWYHRLEEGVVLEGRVLAAHEHGRGRDEG